MPISNMQTKIIENNKVLLVNSKSFKIISDNCKMYGGSFTGKSEISKIILKCKSKVPVILDDQGNIIMFPSNSKCQSNCVWLNYNNIRDYKKNGHKNVVITFLNGTKIAINISFYSFEKQINKCHKLKLDHLEKKMSLIYRNIR